MALQHQQYTKDKRPVLAVERTVRFNFSCGVTTDFGKIETEDKHISFRPYINRYYSKPSCTACLYVTKCNFTSLYAIYFKLVVGHSCSLSTNSDHMAGDVKKPLVKEEFALVGPGCKDTVDVLQFSYNVEEHSFFICTLLVDVYDMVQEATHQPQLNRFRVLNQFCDVKLEVDGEELPAHRTVLAARSSVLERMLAADSKEAHEGRVQIVDFSKKVVKNFLDFLYTDQIQDWGNSELELLQMADKFMVPELRKECLRRLRTCDGPMALELLSTSVNKGPGSEFIDSTLRRRLTTIVLDNMDTLAATRQWEEFKEAHPVLVDIMYGSAATKSAPMSTFTTLSPQLCISLFDQYRY